MSRNPPSRSHRSTRRNPARPSDRTSPRLSPRCGKRRPTGVRFGPARTRRRKKGPIQFAGRRKQRTRRLLPHPLNPFSSSAWDTTRFSSGSAAAGRATCIGDTTRRWSATWRSRCCGRNWPATRTACRRFHAQAAAVARLDHPNIVPMYFCGEDGGHHYFAMQFVDGEPLSHRLDRCGQIPLEEALAIAADCLAALGAAHALGLVHRDVKPGNILMDSGAPSTLGRGQAMLFDFGLVHSQDASQPLTAAGVVLGSVEYMAPEQARGQDIDGRTDIYAVGVMLYQMLAGRLPFTADTPTAMIFQHVNEEPFPLLQASPDVPPPVIEVIARMMAKDPAERYDSCAAVLADLRAFGEGRAGGSGGGGPPGTPRRRARGGQRGGGACGAGSGRGCWHSPPLRPWSWA